MSGGLSSVVSKQKRGLERVLIVDPAPHATRLLSELLRNMGAGEVYTVGTAARGLAMARGGDPRVIFCEYGGSGFDGVEFVRALRRSDFACRRTPVVMITAEATTAAILAARDAGVHEFLRRPFTTADLSRRIQAVLGRPRDWIEGIGYIGPDRRRFNSGDYHGPRKRRTDARATPDKERLLQALRILKSAVAAIDSDPRQALRAMRAQVAELRAVGMAAADLNLVTAVAALDRYLTAAEDSGAVTRAELAAHADVLLGYLPAEEPGRERQAA